MTLGGAYNGETTKHQTPFLISVQEHRRRTIHVTLDWLKLSMAISIQSVVPPIRVSGARLAPQNIPYVFSWSDSDLMMFRCNHCLNLSQHLYSHSEMVFGLTARDDYDK